MHWLRTLLARNAVSRVLSVCAAALVCAVLANPAVAWGHGHHGHHHGGGGGGGGGTAPEIDPNSLAGALTLLAGGILVVTDRLRKK
ncbi:MAG: hypothetical protein ACRELG_20700 [Gemmataceae bacterium]